MADFTSAAVLVWMYPDEEPSIGAFEKIDDENMPEIEGF